MLLLCRPDLFSGLLSSILPIGGAAWSSGGCWCVGVPSTDPSCDGLAGLLVPAGRFVVSIAAYPQCGRLSASYEGWYSRASRWRSPGDWPRLRPRRQPRLRLWLDARRVYDDEYLRRDDGHGGGGDGTGDSSHYDHDVEYVGDMCGCATATRRGLGTAAGKSARRTKSSCSLHSKPGIR